MIYYYSDELNDDFASMERKQITLKENYKYIHKNIFYKIAEFFVYRVIMTPIAFLHVKIKFHHRMINKKVLKKAGKKGYFLYGNHTMYGADAFIPNTITFPRKTKVIVNPCNLSTKGTRTFIEMAGALPTPSSIKQSRNFMEAIDYYTSRGNAIQIYPEAHVWPYCTFVRNFSSVSFRYPVKSNLPCFCFTNTFVKRKHSSSPKVITYVDGPFYPDENIADKKERQEDLRNRVLRTMQDRSKNSSYVINEFRPRGDEK